MLKTIINSSQMIKMVGTLSHITGLTKALVQNLLTARAKQLLHISKQ